MAAGMVRWQEQKQKQNTKAVILRPRRHFQGGVAKEIVRAHIVVVEYRDVQFGVGLEGCEGEDNRITGWISKVKRGTREGSVVTCDTRGGKRGY